MRRDVLSRMDFSAVASCLDEAWQRYLDEDPPEAYKRLPRANRGSWFCPCVSDFDVHRYESWLECLGIRRVYDLGAGDCRLSFYLAEKGYEVIAYETLKEIPIKLGIQTMGWPFFELRFKDYYKDFARLVRSEGEDSSFAFFGGTNRPPWIPRQLTIEGYFERGTRVWLDRRIIDEW